MSSTVTRSNRADRPASSQSDICLHPVVGQALVDQLAVEGAGRRPANDGQRPDEQPGQQPPPRAHQGALAGRHVDRLDPLRPPVLVLGQHHRVAQPQRPLLLQVHQIDEHLCRPVGLVEGDADQMLLGAGAGAPTGEIVEIGHARPF